MPCNVLFSGSDEDWAAYATPLREALAEARVDAALGRDFADA